MSSPSPLRAAFDCLLRVCRQSRPREPGYRFPALRAAAERLHEVWGPDGYRNAMEDLGEPKSRYDKAARALLGLPAANRAYGPSARTPHRPLWYVARALDLHRDAASWDRVCRALERIRDAVAPTTDDGDYRPVSELRDLWGPLFGNNYTKLTRALEGSGVPWKQGASPRRRLVATGPFVDWIKGLKKAGAGDGEVSERALELARKQILEQDRERARIDEEKGRRKRGR
jgi:hypothetical protein